MQKAFEKLLAKHKALTLQIQAAEKKQAAAAAAAAKKRHHKLGQLVESWMRQDPAFAELLAARLKQGHWSQEDQIWLRSFSAQAQS